MSIPFLAKLGILNGTFTIVCYLIFNAGFSSSIQSEVYLSILFLTLLTAIAQLFLWFGFKSSTTFNFMTGMALAFGIKILASLLFLCYFIYFQPIENKNFILFYFALYFLDTALLVFQNIYKKGN